MKTTKYLLMAAMVTLAVNLSANAGGPILSPKAAQFRAEAKKAPYVASQPNLTSNRPIGNAKAWELTQSVRKVPTTAATVDLAHAPRPMYSPKDSRFETALRENAVRTFEVAPLK